MGYQKNGLKQTLTDIAGGPKKLIFLSDLASRFGIFYHNSLNVPNHNDAVLKAFAVEKRITIMPTIKLC